MTSRTPAETMHSCFYLFLAALLLQPLCASRAVAKDLLFVPRLSLSVARYEFFKPPTVNGLPNGDEFPEMDFDLTFKFLGLGGTWFKNGYYLDLSYQASTKESITFTAEHPDFPGGKFSTDFDGRRRDYSLTIGKKIFDGRGGIYTGYKEGKSGGPQSRGQHSSFEEKGFFIGGNYGWPISDLGIISLNLAYAKMDGNRILKSSVDLNGNRVIDLNGNGDADGLSYGATWSSRLTDNISYSIGLEVRKYSFDNIKDINPERVPFTDELEETFTGVNFSTYYLF